ncbi:hypothetical protein EMIHUDRAFT_247548 [Emiliania huxleyi CCMP1516]|uniref:Uncharacterized protein n=2 Tax=Emiliania huxleyi TaxID=2903 RepID=A0A0D3ILX4_EMIH1|nr:hypothetical protein EMIHUDRAFT_247548 [Emiliania huxleyi CCMP1516]EOD12259.1 hypothetical protein EMIHUDRAFT_247548 [Emiliania huxleyi CCMP1516]|eukprot:XP_005764688.1 hypothetical protein EMIHUDRAFT_247548 [Emiliania huxleyi CCMP1516]
MPDLTAAELSIPAEQHPDPAKPLVIPVDSTVVGSTLRFIPWSVVGNPALLQLPPPPPGMQPSWVQIPQWVAISALLPFSEPEPAVATHFDRLSVLRLAVLAAAWRRILGALSDLGVFSTVHVDEDAFRTVCIQALHSRQIPVPELYLQWGDLGYSEAIVPLGPAPSAEAKAVDFLQYATVGALCDPTADVPFAALSDMTRCLGPVFTAAARVDPMGSAVVGAASLAAAAGHITPRASDGHPALLSRHVLSMLKTTRSSFPACLRTNSFQNYSAEVETRAEYVGGTAVARDRVAEQRCSRAIAAKAPTLDSLLRALPRPTPPSVVYEAYRQLVSLYFPTDRRPMDLLLTDLDAQLHARLPTYQHALTNGKPFASILAGLRKLHESLEPSRKAPVMTSTGDSEDCLGVGQNAVRKIGSIDLSTPTGPLEVIKEVFLSDSMILQRYVIFQEAALATKHEIFGVIQGVRHHLGRYLGSVVAMENGSVPPGLEDFSLGETERLMHAQRVAAKTTSLTRFADPPLMPKHELMLRGHYASVDLYNAPGGASEPAALKANKKGHMVEAVAVSAQFRDAHVLRRVQAFWGPFFTARGFNANPSSTHHTFHSLACWVLKQQLEESGQEHRALLRHAQPANAKFDYFCARGTTALGKDRPATATRATPACETFNSSIRAARPMETQPEASVGAAQADRRQLVPPAPGATAFKRGRPIALSGGDRDTGDGAQLGKTYGSCTCARLGVFCRSPFDGRPQGGGHLEPPARDSSGGCPGFIYPLGPGTYFRTDHFAQQPSAAAF